MSLWRESFVVVVVGGGGDDDDDTSVRERSGICFVCKVMMRRRRRD